MATQYDPIAKDGSLNTTEATPRNIADVLAEGLKGIEDALPPSYTEGDGVDISNNEISVDTTFTEASTRTNIASGESFSTILGKIKKFFTDLKTVAFTGAYSDLSGTENVAVKNADNQFSLNQTVDRKDGTTSAIGNSILILGNSTPSGTDKNSRGCVSIFGNSSFFTELRANNSTANRTIQLPDASGTIALLEDFKPSSGTTSGMASSYGTIQTGYVRIGNMIVLNMRLTVGNTAIPAGTLFVSGLPPAIESNVNHVACSTNQPGLAVQINGDKLQNPASSIPADSTLFVSAVYFTGM